MRGQLGQDSFFPSSSTSVTYENSRIVKDTPGYLCSITGYNSNSSVQFIQIHDINTIPVSGAIPDVILTVAGNSNFTYSSDKWCRVFIKGIVVVNSSTGPTYTAGSNNCWFDVLYV